MEYKKYFLKEVYICSKHINLSYSDIMNMPTYERRFYLDELLKEVKQQQDDVDRQTKSNESGKRTRKVEM